MGKQGVLAWEKRWAVPVAIATLLAVVLLIASSAASQVSGDNPAEALRSVDEHHGSVVLSGILQAVGFLLMMAPLYYLFRAAKARAPRMRTQMVGLVLVAPLFLAVSSGLTIGARSEAADEFVAGEAKSTLAPKEAKEKCASDLKDEGANDFREEFEPKQGKTPTAACERLKTEEDEAENAIGEAGLAPLVSGLGLAGGLAFVVAFLYTSLWAMRVGLLSRFWGSLGMVAGIAFLLGPLFVVALVWLVYFGAMLIGKVPGGKPPAWEAGEAVPWPTPGEQAAAELEPSEPAGEAGGEGGAGDGAAGDGAEKRKRKRRD